MDPILLFIGGIAALSSLLGFMIYLLSVARAVQLTDIDEA